MACAHPNFGAWSVCVSICTRIDLLQLFLAAILVQTVGNFYVFTFFWKILFSIFNDCSGFWSIPILIVVYGEVEEKTFRSGLFLFDIYLFLVLDLWYWESWFGYFADIRLYWIQINSQVMTYRVWKCEVTVTRPTSQIMLGVG